MRAAPCIARIDSSVALEEQLIDYKSSWRKHLIDNPTAVRERGAPLVILVAASAVQANNLAKHLPRINKVLQQLCWQHSQPDLLEAPICYASSLFVMISLQMRTSILESTSYM